MGQGFEVNEDACDISWLPFSSMHAINGKLIKTSVFEALGLAELLSFWHTEYCYEKRFGSARRTFTSNQTPSNSFGLECRV